MSIVSSPVPLSEQDINEFSIIQQLYELIERKIGNDKFITLVFNKFIHDKKWELCVFLNLILKILNCSEFMSDGYMHQFSNNVNILLHEHPELIWGILKFLSKYTDTKATTDRDLDNAYMLVRKIRKILSVEEFEQVIIIFHNFRMRSQQIDTRETNLSKLIQSINCLLGEEYPYLLKDFYNFFIFIILDTLDTL